MLQLVPVFTLQIFYVHSRGNYKFEHIDKDIESITQIAVNDKIHSKYIYIQDIMKDLY